MHGLIHTLLLTLLAGSLLGCASARKTRMAWTAGAFTAGAAVGAASAPENERRELHSLYWAGLLGVGAALLGEVLLSDEKEAEALRLENEKLRAEMELIQSANRVLLKEGKGYFKTSQGEESFPVGKAKWRLYQIDRWVKDGPDRLYHQDRMVEIIPAESK